MIQIFSKFIPTLQHTPNCTYISHSERSPNQEIFSTINDTKATTHFQWLILLVSSPFINYCIKLEIISAWLLVNMAPFTFYYKVTTFKNEVNTDIISVKKKKWWEHVIRAQEPGWWGSHSGQFQHQHNTVW